VFSYLKIERRRKRAPKFLVVREGRNPLPRVNRLRGGGKERPVPRKAVLSEKKAGNVGPKRPWLKLPMRKNGREPNLNHFSTKTGLPKGYIHLQLVALDRKRLVVWRDRKGG